MQIQFPAEPIGPFQLCRLNKKIDKPSREDLIKIISEIEKRLDFLCDERLRYDNGICLFGYEITLTIKNCQGVTLFISGAADLSSEDLRDSGLDHFKGTYKREFRWFLDRYKSPEQLSINIDLYAARDMITRETEALDF